jgi:uncharacterized LabA/DUF88 family protein
MERDVMFVDRTALFIDGGYFDRLLDSEFNRVRVDFGLLVDRIAAGDKVLRTYYYHCPPYMSPRPTEDELRRAESKDRFFSALTTLPRFQLRLGHLMYRGTDEGGKPIFIQKLVDIMLGTDLVLLSATRQITRAILLTGDSDFVPAVEAAKRQGTQVTLYHGPMVSGSKFGTVHRELWASCDERFELTRELIESVQRPPSNYSNGGQA